MQNLSTFKGKVVKDEIIVHPKADGLETVLCGGLQVIAPNGQSKSGWASGMYKSGKGPLLFDRALH